MSDDYHLREHPKIVIIGAGIAGLTCAYRLHKAGIKCKVFEASERVGGRCWSIRDYFSDNQIAEHGGEIIDSSHIEIQSLVKELGLKLDKIKRGTKNDTLPFYFFNGQRYSNEDALKDWQKISIKVKNDYDESGSSVTYDNYTKRSYELDHMSVREWINETVEGGLDSNLGRLLDIACTIRFGGETNKQSSLNIVNMLASESIGGLNILDMKNESYHIRGGNDQLPWRLYRSLPNGTVKFKTQLISIAKVKYDKYKLIFQSAVKVASVMADIVVLALPFSVLKLNVNYEKAGFSDLKKFSIDDLEMGTNSKINVQFTNRYWRKNGNNGTTYSNIGYQSSWEHTVSQFGSHGILVNYTGGKNGATFNNQDYLRQYTETFINRLDRIILRYNAKWNGKAVLDYWTGQPWALGSYPYYKIGQYTKFAGIEGVTEDRCMFAGDHTSLKYHGLMNGAVESGERVSREIIGMIKE